MPDEPTDEQIDAFDEAKDEAMDLLRDLDSERFRTKREAFDEINRVVVQAYEKACARREIGVDPEQVELLCASVVLSLRLNSDPDFSWVDDLGEDVDDVPPLTEKEELLAIISEVIASDPVFRRSADPAPEADRAVIILERLAADRGLEITDEDRMYLACDVFLMWGGNYVNRRDEPE